MREDRLEYNWTTGQKFYAIVVKRILDIVFSLIFLGAFFWVYLIIAILIAKKDGFPVIYKQERVGKNKVHFPCFKFRSMVKNADKIGPTSTAVGDPRITKIGAILRKTSLDELPQVANVLRGEMSFIGFRPDVPRENEAPTLKYAVKPGISGYAQVMGRSNISGEDRNFYQNEYVRKISFGLDFKILLKTFKTVLGKEGTN